MKSINQSSSTKQQHFRRSSGGNLLICSFIALGGLVTAGQAEEARVGNSKFTQDREAILSMAGEFKVTFRFHETLSLDGDYTIKPEKYEESALEKVFVVEDSGEQIVLQHVLLAGDMVVKHWGQIWTFNDTATLSFEGGLTWEGHQHELREIQGHWTQLVTQTTDQPRYEAHGEWIHFPHASVWESHSNRPLPRREHTKRDDYDLLKAFNRHTVTSNGWYHEQDNVKWVRRDGSDAPLCREYGFNSYERVNDKDFSSVDEYWAKSKDFWQAIRAYWGSVMTDSKQLKIAKRVNLDTLPLIVGKLEKEQETDPEKIRASLSPFITRTTK